MEKMAYSEDSSVSGPDEPWIQWFCGLKGHEMFCEVERAYIEDGFNLYGLRACVSNFSDCLDLILDRIGPDDSDDSHLTQSACTLYGLIHARYIVTAHGLDSMYTKYVAKDFGSCPLVQCNGQPVLPMGLKDDIGIDTVKIFCPKCQCVYQPLSFRSRSGGHHSSSSSSAGSIDGAAFGTTFPHLFLMTFNNLLPDPLPSDSAYIPRVFGFRVHQNERRQNSTRGLESLNASTTSRTNKGGRGGAMSAFTTQRLTSVISIANTGADGTVLSDSPIHEPMAAGEEVVEVKSEKSSIDTTSQPDPSNQTTKTSNASILKSESKKLNATNGDGSAQKKDCKFNDGLEVVQPKRNLKSEGGNSVASNDNGSSRNKSSKRQRRDIANYEVT